jgi:small conductance mechanosensitive channel
MGNLKAFLADLWDTVYAWILSDGIRLVVGIIAFFICLKIAKGVAKRVRKKMTKKNVERTVVQVTYDVLLVVLRIVAILVFLAIVGINTASVSAAIAAAGLTIGLALQGAFSNLAGGVIILTMGLFRDGDFIESAGVSGTVEAIKMFYTHLVTPDNRTVTVPNGQLANGVIVNYSKKDTRRVDFLFSIAYDADYAKAKEILLDLCDRDARVLPDPAPFVNMSAHGASSIDITVRVWVKSEHYWAVNFAMYEGVKAAFDANGIEIPFPQMDVHLPAPKN